MVRDILFVMGAGPKKILNRSTYGKLFFTPPVLFIDLKGFPWEESSSFWTSSLVKSQ